MTDYKKITDYQEDLVNPKWTNMENYGVQTDIMVENTTEDNLAGRDR